jgi:hypothetical protein
MRRWTLALAMGLLAAWGMSVAQDSIVFGDGGWWYFPDQDPVTDENFNYITSIPRELPEGQEGANMQVRCKSGTEHGVEVVLYADKRVGENHAAITVDYQLDDTEPNTGSLWTLDRRGWSLFLPEEQIPDFLATAQQASDLVVDVHTGETLQRFKLRVDSLTPALEFLECYSL